MNVGPLASGAAASAAAATVAGPCGVWADEGGCCWEDVLAAWVRPGEAAEGPAAAAAAGGALGMAAALSGALDFSRQLVGGACKEK